MLKLATSVRLAEAVKVYEANAETGVPFSVQLRKFQFALGVATTVTDCPVTKLPPPLVLPPATGFAEVAIVYLCLPPFSIKTSSIYQKSYC